ncbi:signal transduction histidine kinase [Herbaspirillum sp. Sphag1AN]|uniref:sensor histidine kinase n=1 Tax=unclassified Herbaspirillum TaxID=2624150 RepID=UPI00160C511B|nr:MULTISPECIES: HAMP domain-containing sensor histidine kinase [unclassified Herbaspirillum]MBB3213076.1 signal transduction histidine kinase [Herbaspirillum sp. Sphag1AN]MBB3246273.1 signal transduction histidine kinase [Herbaspirillum sp. Sphag64]
MDPLTASVALSVTQLCISAIMAGTYFAAPVERCTRFWAMSGLLTGMGMTIALLNASRPAKTLLALGNIGLFAGCVVVWMGLKIFFGKPATRWGYLLIALFSFLFVVMLANDADFTARSYLVSASLILVFVLCLQTLLTSVAEASPAKRSFGRGMAISGLLLLTGAHIVRIATSMQAPELFRPETISHFGAVVVYLVPLAGTLLFFSALLLLYFERIKDNLLLSLAAKQEALETQIRFVDMFSHEYRTPLAVIRTNLDILESKDQSSGERLAPNLTKMRRAVLRLVEVAETALSVGPTPGNEVELRRENIVAPDFVRAIIEEASLLWSERDPQLRLVHADAVVFSGDRRLLKTALLNLLDNAIKYGPRQGSVMVELSVADGLLILTVNDEGPGIPEQELTLVFGKYFRGSRTGFIGGSGVGLYLVQRIVSQHGGSICLSNRPTGGTTATITLPFSDRRD